VPQTAVADVKQSVLIGNVSAERNGIEKLVMMLILKNTIC